jgi:transcription termination factor Rho
MMTHPQKRSGNNTRKNQHKQKGKKQQNKKHVSNVLPESDADTLDERLNDIIPQARQISAE